MAHIVASTEALRGQVSNGCINCSPTLTSSETLTPKHSPGLGARPNAQSMAATVRPAWKSDVNTWRHSDRVTQGQRHQRRKGSGGQSTSTIHPNRPQWGANHPPQPAHEAHARSLTDTRRMGIDGASALSPSLARGVRTWPPLFQP